MPAASRTRLLQRKRLPSMSVADEVPITQRPCVTRQCSWFSDDDLLLQYTNTLSGQEDASTQSEHSSDEEDRTDNEEQSSEAAHNTSSPLQGISPPQAMPQQDTSSTCHIADRHTQLLSRRLSSRRVSFVQVPASPSLSPRPAFPSVSADRDADSAVATKTTGRRRANSLRYDRFLPPSCGPVDGNFGQAPRTKGSAQGSDTMKAPVCPPLSQRRVTVAAPLNTRSEQPQTRATADNSFEQVRQAWYPGSLLGEGICMNSDALNDDVF
jgi:hypothetical protein